MLAAITVGAKLRLAKDPPNGTVRRMLGEDVLLVAMVKDEERSIGRMLESSKQVATHWLVCDTGSTDGTLDIVRKHAANNGESLWIAEQGPFVNFEHNRNACLEWARTRILGAHPSIEWVLLMDADHVLVPSWEHGRAPPADDVNYIAIQTRDGLYNVDNTLPYLIRATTLEHCAYRLYTHEILQCAEGTLGNYRGFVYVHSYWEGPASKGNKYERDARLLRQWIAEHGAPDDDDADLVPRARFYLARSQQGAGNYSDAIGAYEEHRAVEIYTNYWFYSTYSRAVCIHRLCGANFTTCGYTMDQVEGAFLDAHDEMDGYFRREPLFYLARMHASNGNYSRCLLYSTAGMFAPPIDHARMPLFVERVVYDWALEEQHAACLEGLGRGDEARAHYRKLLAYDRMGRDVVERIRAKLLI